LLLFRREEAKDFSSLSRFFPLCAQHLTKARLPLAALLQSYFEVAGGRSVGCEG
jgi:hypothetical protein